MSVCVCIYLYVCIYESKPYLDKINKASRNYVSLADANFKNGLNTHFFNTNNQQLILIHSNLKANILKVSRACVRACVFRRVHSVMLNMTFDCSINK